MFQIISTVVKEAKGKDFYLGPKPKDRKASVVVAVVTKVRQLQVDDFQGKWAKDDSVSSSELQRFWIAFLYN